VLQASNSHAHLDPLHQDAGWVEYVVSGTSAMKLPSLDGNRHQNVSQITSNSAAIVSPLLSLFFATFSSFFY
jgi:hypothetical protein